MPVVLLFLEWALGVCASLSLAVGAIYILGYAWVQLSSAQVSSGREVVVCLFAYFVFTTFASMVRSVRRRHYPGLDAHLDSLRGKHG